MRAAPGRGEEGRGGGGGEGGGGGGEGGGGAAAYSRADARGEARSCVRGGRSGAMAAMGPAAGGGGVSPVQGRR